MTTPTLTSCRPDVALPTLAGQTAAPGAAPSDDDAAEAAWRCAKHEAGHLAYGIIACNCVPDYAVITASAGLCGNIRTASAWRAGIFAACGPIAGALSAPRPERIAPPPASWPFLPIQLSTPAAVLAVAVGCISDSEELARCVVGGAFAEHPETWLSRRAAILQAAADFVETNRAAIIAVAVELFKRGALPGDTAASILNTPNGEKR